jgi:hypothetical protein
VPDSSCIAWPQPDIMGHEPDFILYGHDFGLVIFEVKDWILEQIVAAECRISDIVLGATRFLVDGEPPSGDQPPEAGHGVPEPGI